MILYPFTAIVGQERMKRALILNAINHRIGGVLIRGERGTAKSTAARALAALLPEIEVVADCPFNCDPDGITFPIPGNDDAGRAIALYCDLISRAAIDGIERAQGSAGMDVGAAEEPLAEPGLEGEDAPKADAKPEPKKAEKKPAKAKAWSLPRTPW